MKLSAVILPVLIALSSVTIYRHFTSVSVSRADLKTHLKNKVVLLCGTGFGIGEQLTYELAKQGAKLFLVSRKEQKYITLKDMAHEHNITYNAINQVEKLMVARTESQLENIKIEALKLGSPQVEFMNFDLANVTGAHTLVDETIKSFGKIDYMVLNHAEMPRGYFTKVIPQQAPEFINRIFSVNVFSHIEIALKALPYLEKSKGHIFVTSSMLGEIPNNERLSLYSSTKHALNGFFYSLQQELIAKNSPVTLTIGALGMIKTEEMMSLFKIPEWMVGDMKECALGMMNSLISRPTTFTYPTLHPSLARLYWYFSY